MIKIERNAALARAITRAKSEDIHVKAVKFGECTVENRTRQTRYTVTLEKRNGSKLGTCTCKAGESSMMCKHVAVAVSLHIHLASRKA